jgi:hypothetical protein
VTVDAIVQSPSSSTILLNKQSVAAARHQYVEHRAGLVDRVPHPVLLAVDGDRHFLPHA